MRAYLTHCRVKARTTIAGLTEEWTRRVCRGSAGSNIRRVAVVRHSASHRLRLSPSFNRMKVGATQLPQSGLVQQPFPLASPFTSKPLVGKPEIIPCVVPSASGPFQIMLGDFGNYSDATQAVVSCTGGVSRSGYKRHRPSRFRDRCPRFAPDPPFHHFRFIILN